MQNYISSSLQFQQKFKTTGLKLHELTEAETPELRKNVPVVIQVRVCLLSLSLTVNVYNTFAQ